MQGLRALTRRTYNTRAHAHTHLLAEDCLYKEACCDSVGVEPVVAHHGKHLACLLRKPQPSKRRKQEPVAVLPGSV